MRVCRVACVPASSDGKPLPRDRHRAERPRGIRAGAADAVFADAASCLFCRNGGHSLTTAFAAVLCAMEAVDRYDNEPMLAFLKSGISPLARDEADRLENTPLHGASAESSGRKRGRCTPTASVRSGTRSAARSLNSSMHREAVLFRRLRLCEGHGMRQKCRGNGDGAR